jgi:hypothetical protein
VSTIRLTLRFIRVGERRYTLGRPQQWSDCGAANTGTMPAASRAQLDREPIRPSENRDCTVGEASSSPGLPSQPADRSSREIG